MVIVLKPENVAKLVFFIRGEKVMLDADLAMLYGVEVRILNQAVARNRKRFPSDFMFQLSANEYENLRSDCDFKREKGLRCAFEVTICDLKTRARRPAIPSLRIHRARRRDAFQRAAQLPRR